MAGGRVFAGIVVLAVLGSGCLVGIPFEGNPDSSPTPSGSGTPTSTPTASPTPEPWGDATDGALSVDQELEWKYCDALLSVNGAQIDSPVAAQVGDRLLLHQTQEADLQATSGTTAGSLLTGTNAGRWEVVEVVSTSPLETDPAPSYDFGSDGTRRAQACVMPQFETATITASGVLRAAPWDGSSGGIVAFFVQDVMQLDGDIDAGGRGFRGGRERPQNADFDLFNLDYASASGQAGGKGEGLQTGARALSGRGAITNGAGGGNAHNAGGGGGGNGGIGGFGGRQADLPGTNDPSSNNVRGYGGGKVDQPLDSSLTFGGGGGAGHRNEDCNGINDGLGCRGGPGGGIIVIIANTLQGGGALAADGADGDQPINDGAGGGGAGGTIWVQSASTGSLTAMIHANGGDGGSPTDANEHGPGGGGGGGRIGVSFGEGTVSVSPGGGGTTNAQTYGATNGDQGVVESLQMPDGGS